MYLEYVHECMEETISLKKKIHIEEKKTKNKQEFSVSDLENNAVETEMHNFWTK